MQQFLLQYICAANQNVRNIEVGVVGNAPVYAPIAA